MGANRTSKQYYLRVSILALLCLGSFCVAYYTDAPLTPEQPTKPNPTGSVESRPPPLTSSKVPRFLEQPLKQLRSTFESGDSFRIHYQGLCYTQELSPASIESLLRNTTDLKGLDGNILSVIFGLDLAFRDPSRLQRLLADSKFQSGSSIPVDLIFNYWAKSRPETALANAITLPSAQRSRALAGISQSGNPDIAKRANAYRQRPRENQDSTGPAREQLRQAIANKDWRQNREVFLQSFRAAYPQDPVLGMKAALEIDDPTIRQLALEQLSYNQWQNPIEALEFVLQRVTSESVPSPDRRRNILSQIFRHLDESNYSTALDLLHQRLSPQERRLVYQQLSPSSGDSVLALLQSDFLESIPNSPQKQSHLQNTLMQLARDDWAKSFELMSELLPPRAADNALPQLINYAYQSDGSEAAIQLLQAATTDQSRIHSIMTLAQSWGGAEPMDFITWSLSQPNPKDFANAQSQVAQYWANKDLTSLLEFTREIDESPLKQNLQSGLASHYAQTDPLRAIEYASQLQDLEMAAPIISQSATHLGRTEPELALELLISAFPDHQHTTNGIRQIAHYWANEDPESAVHYFSGLENPNHAQTGLFPALASWMQHEPTEALEFIKTMPDSAERDAALSRIGLSAQYTRRDPDFAEKVISLIKDPAIKQIARRQLESNRPLQW